MADMLRAEMSRRRSSRVASTGSCVTAPFGSSTGRRSSTYGAYPVICTVNGKPGVATSIGIRQGSNQPVGIVRPSKRSSGRSRTGGTSPPSESCSKPSPRG